MSRVINQKIGPSKILESQEKTISKSNIKNLYQSEFEYRLRKRNVKAKLKEQQSAVND